MALIKPIVEDLRVGYLNAGVYYTDITADTDGMFYSAGDVVKIVGDEMVGLMDKTDGECSIGILENGIPARGRTNPDARDRVSVLTKYNYKLIATAEGTVTAGEFVVDGTTTAGTFKTADSPDTDAAHVIRGVCWKGGADGETIEILV